MRIKIISSKSLHDFQSALEEYLAGKREEDIVSIQFQQSSATPQGHNMITIHTVVIVER